VFLTITAFREWWKANWNGNKK